MILIFLLIIALFITYLMRLKRRVSNWCCNPGAIGFAPLLTVCNLLVALLAASYLLLIVGVILPPLYISMVVIMVWGIWRVRRLPISGCGKEWSRRHLTEEEIAIWEERFSIADRAMESSSQLEDIGKVIENWAERRNPSYLRAGITLSEVAEEMKMPATILSSHINKRLDMNFNQWINSYRIKHVKSMLLTTDYNLDEISDLCGFGTRNLMSRIFKAHVGCTPSEFRNSNNGRRCAGRKSIQNGRNSLQAGRNRGQKGEGGC